MADCQWHSWTCSLGFPVMGVWPPYSDGTDVNMVDRSKNRKLVVTAEDTFKITLFRFPCLKGTKGKQVSCFIGVIQTVVVVAFFVFFCFLISFFFVFLRFSSFFTTLNSLSLSLSLFLSPLPHHSFMDTCHMS